MFLRYEQGYRVCKVKVNLYHDHRNAAMSNYQEALDNLPPSGGSGCHTALLKVANIGVNEGLAKRMIFNDLRKKVTGSRMVPDSEIYAAIDKAITDNKSGTTAAPKQNAILKRKPIDGPKVMQQLLTIGKSIGDDFYNNNEPDWPEEDDHIVMLERLYAPDDLLFIGELKAAGKIGENIRSAKEWIKVFNSGEKPGPHIIPNPLTGKLAKTKNNKKTLRGDNCIADFRYAVVEFDNISIEEQLDFWAAAKLPCEVLIFSGGKSIHGWVRLEKINSLSDWDTNIKQKLFASYLEPLGVDPACKNPSRLSRMPGHYRKEKREQQTIEYLIKR